MQPAVNPAWPSQQPAPSLNPYASPSPPNHWQAQVALAEAQGRDTERLLTEQLRAAQAERNTCLAAATRADALLVRLGQHAMLTRGMD